MTLNEPVYHYAHAPFRTDAEKLDEASREVMAALDTGYLEQVYPHEHDLNCTPGCQLPEGEIEDDAWGITDTEGDYED